MLNVVGSNLLLRYGRTITIKRLSEHLEVNVRATSREFKPANLVGQVQQATRIYIVASSSFVDQEISEPRRLDRLIDSDGQVYTVESVQPVHFRDEIVQYRITVNG